MPGAGKKIHYERAAQALAPREHEILKAQNFINSFAVSFFRAFVIKNY